MLLVVVAPLLARCSPAIPNFQQDIAPIIYKNCAACHRPGEAGPFPLLSYRDVRAHGRQIVAVTGARYMPPWLPEPGSYAFSDERRLSKEQIALIQRWVEGGMPEGDAAHATKPPAFEPGWQLGKPDLIVTAAKPFVLPATGSDVYWNFVVPVPVDGTRWLRALEIRPGDKRLVHHANILLDRLQSAREMEQTAGSGFGGMEIRVESETFDPDSHLLFWKPGSPALEQPRGMAVRIDKGTDLLLNVHLQPSGKPEQIQPSIGLYFTDEPASVRPMLLELENDAALKIPAGARNFQVSDRFTLPVAVDLLAIYPHAHYLGKDMQATATLPDGSRTTLLHIADWDLNWQGVYTYVHPVVLPKATLIEMVYTYNNSADNARNPNNPPVEVRGGNRASDEMAHLWLQVLPHATASDGDPRLVLQEALSRHEVEKDPTVFEAQYNLAAMLLNKGQPREALSHYEAAARLRPNDPVVRNALGSAESAAGQAPEAIQSFQRSLALRPRYFDAHYNLGLALASLGQFSQAENELRKAVALKPDDADAHANLGAALAQLNRLQEAQAEFQRALALKPDNQLAKENLAVVQQMTGRP